MSTQTTSLNLRQHSFPELCPITSAVEELAQSTGVEARGAVFTRREVVEFILDLAGYRAEQPLWKMRLLEPSFGGGDFLLMAVERLLHAWRNYGGNPQDFLSLSPCIRAVELHQETFNSTRSSLIALLTRHGAESSVSEDLARSWLVYGDFLLAPLDGVFDVVVGNPPYVRQELIPAALLAEYRSRYTTVYDRADLYIPFIERSLLQLSSDGKLGFICADRWMKNRYGGPLRKLVTEKFALEIYVDMVGAEAFHSDVSAYPAITIIGKSGGKTTRIAHRPTLDRDHLSNLATELTSAELPRSGSVVREISIGRSGAEPWILDSSERMTLLRRLEADYPAIEEAGCKVGIGVATGSDKSFIGQYADLDVEPDRKLPLVMTRDIVSGEVRWRGLGVVNPFNNDGGLVDLHDYPRLRRYLEIRKADIVGRHCAQKTPANWYRTIDRITPSLARTPKLLIPDIKGDAQIVHEDGQLYPHHNLYFIASGTWDLKALQAVLLSGIARLFVSTYSTKMRGGYLRFQAQYLRRIHIPAWADVTDDLRGDLVSAAMSKDVDACNRAVTRLYNLTDQERVALSENHL